MTFRIHYTAAVASKGYEIVSGIAPSIGTTPDFFYVQRNDITEMVHLPETRLNAFLALETVDPRKQAPALLQRFGLLGPGLDIHVATTDGRLQVRHGEPLNRWLDELPRLTHAITTWQMSFAASWEEWDGFFHEPGEVRASRAGDPGELQNMKRGCRELAARVVEQRLNGPIGFDLRAAPGLATLLAPDLGTYLWLELAQGIVGEVLPASCEVCSEWYPVSGHRHRTDKKYCSDACRMRSYRSRKNPSTRQTSSKRI